MKIKLLVTGGAGFIGSNFIKYLLGLNDAASEEVIIVNLDSLTYCGNLENLKEVESNIHYKYINGDIRSTDLIKYIIKEQKIDGIINFAAESHVDRSIHNANPFVDTNIIGTLSLLQAAKECGVERFLQISTDEVYGSLGEVGKFVESTQISPNSPYSASKAAADHLVRAYNKTYGLNTLITRCSNNYGPYQFPEKLIPLMIINALEGKQLPVYGDGLNVRDWIYVEDHCIAIWEIFCKAKSGEVFNIGADEEKKNIDIIKSILVRLNKTEELIEFVQDRPGHDRRYAMDFSKLENSIGWRPKVSFEAGLEKTIQWYLENETWYKRIRSGEYLNYYKTQYGKKL